MLHATAKPGNVSDPKTWGVFGSPSYLFTDLSFPPIYQSPPKIVLVIGTFASVPYVHLHLEMQKRKYPHIPILVHDDGSHKQDELKALCVKYGAGFESNNVRLPPFMGDLTTYVGGLKWAADSGADILVKMSRRFLPTENWSSSLSALAMESQYPTFSSWCRSYKFGFRTECVGMSVRRWIDMGLFGNIVNTVSGNATPDLVEAYMHRLARHAVINLCYEAHAYDVRVGQRPFDRDGYAVWPFMGTDRREKCQGFVWHNSHKPVDYLNVSESMGLPYTLADFVDPNQGAGNRPAGF